MNDSRIIVLYHARCPDGFGAAYAAWKKFGDTAEYLPLTHGAPVPEDLDGAHLYFVDFCYPKAVMDDIAERAAALTVLDHHLGMREVVETMPDFVFDENHSGAVLSWQYFHPDTPVPTLLTYVEDGDLHRFTHSDARTILLSIYTLPHDFERWDAFARALEQETTYAEILARSQTYADYHHRIVAQLADAAVPVRFEGYDCFLADAPRMFATDVAELLLAKKPTLALLIHAETTGISVSLRSTGVIDVAAIARKYGRNGHPTSSAIFVSYESSLPWTLIEESPVTVEPPSDLHELLLNAWGVLRYTKLHHAPSFD